MEMEFTDIMMEEYLKENGDLERSRVEENFQVQMDIYKLVNGKQISSKYE